MIGANETNSSDMTDFEENYESQARKVDVLALAGTTFIFDLTYSAFKTRIASPILWSDVKFLEDDDNSFQLYLLTENPL